MKVERQKSAKVSWKTERYIESFERQTSEVNSRKSQNRINDKHIKTENNLENEEFERQNLTERQKF